MSVLSAIVGWFNPQRLLYTVAAIMVAGLVWKATDFVSDKYAAEALVIELQQKVEDRDEALSILNKQLAQREQAQETADAVRDLVDTRRESIEEMRRAAASVKEEDDGALAPVLLDTLRSIDGL